MISLNLYQRLARGSAHYANITPNAPNWQRATATIGGYKVGSFTAHGLTRDQMIDWYDRYLGCRIVETTAGMVTWEGLVYEMRLILDGVEYCRTLAPEWFHNRVQVIYSTDIGLRTVLAWSENTDSSDEFGEMNYQISLGGATSAGATALQSRHLTEFAWPRSRMVGAIAIGKTNRQDSLQVSCAGYQSTLNWRYRESNLTAADADAHISTLVAASEFVTAGRIEDNTLSTHLTVSNAIGLGDLIADIIALGDASGNVWKGGVYAGRKFVYEQAPTTVSHYLREGMLVDRSGRPVIASLTEPGFLLYNSAAPTGTQPAGTASAWDNPQVAYVEEVSIGLPDKFNLKLYGVEESVELLNMKLRKGTA